MFGVVRLSRGPVSHRGQACCHVLPSTMQREPPISLARSLSASIQHQVAGSRGVVVGDRPTVSKAASVYGVVRLRRGPMPHRGQASRLVLPSAMQREQPISLVRSLSASIEHRVAGSRGGRRRPGWGSHHGRLLEEALAILPSLM